MTRTTSASASEIQRSSLRVVVGGLGAAWRPSVERGNPYGRAKRLRRQKPPELKERRLPGVAARDLHLARRCERVRELPKAAPRIVGERCRCKSHRVGHVVGLPPDLDLMVFRVRHLEYLVEAAIDVKEARTADVIPNSG